MCYYYWFRLVTDKASNLCSGDVHEMTYMTTIVEWRANTMGPGVVCKLPYSPDRPNVVLPSRNAYKPPEDAPAKIRYQQPEPGEAELAMLVPSPDGKVLFAYPAASSLKVDERHGFFHIMVEGKAEMTAVPAFACKVVAWTEGEDIHIVVRPVE